MMEGLGTGGILWCCGTAGHDAARWRRNGRGHWRTSSPCSQRCCSSRRPPGRSSRPIIYWGWEGQKGWILARGSWRRLGLVERADDGLEQSLFRGDGWESLWNAFLYIDIIIITYVWRMDCVKASSALPARRCSADAASGPAAGRRARRALAGLQGHRGRARRRRSGAEGPPAHYPRALRRLQVGHTDIQRPEAVSSHLSAMRADGNAEVKRWRGKRIQSSLDACLVHFPPDYLLVALSTLRLRPLGGPSVLLAREDLCGGLLRPRRPRGSSGPKRPKVVHGRDELCSSTA